jgi:hypothetical protein
MTTASIRTIAHQAHGLERLALSVGLALVNWGRVRAERTAISRDEHARRIELARSTTSREHTVRRYGIAA